MQNIITTTLKETIPPKLTYDFKEKLPEESFYDEIADKYDEEYSYSLAQAENEFITEKIQSQGIHTGKILDLGCGTGLFLDYIKINATFSTSNTTVTQRPDDHYIYWCVDQSTYATAVHEICVREHSGNNFPKEFFDNVISLFGSFSYVQEPGKTIESVYNILKTNGKFFMMLCTERNKKRKNYVGNKFGNKTELFTYTYEKVQDYFKFFRDVEVRGYNYLADDLPAEFDKEFYKKYLAAEDKVFGEQYPYNHYYILVTGKK